MGLKAGGRWGGSPLAAAGMGRGPGQPHPDGLSASPGLAVPVRSLSLACPPPRLFSRLPRCLAPSGRSEVLAVGLQGLNLVFPTARSSGTVLSILLAQSLAAGLAHHWHL